MSAPTRLLDAAPNRCGLDLTLSARRRHARAGAAPYRSLCASSAMPRRPVGGAEPLSACLCPEPAISLDLCETPVAPTVREVTGRILLRRSPSSLTIDSQAVAARTCADVRLERIDR